MTFWKWSRTASSNATADGTCPWPEGMPGAQVNDSARGVMAAASKYRDDTSGGLTTTGTSTAYEVSSYQGFDTLAHLDKNMIVFFPHVANGDTVTLKVDLLAAKPLRSAPSVELAANFLSAGVPYGATYYAATDEYILHGVYKPAIAPGSIASNLIADKAVTLRKLYHPSGVSKLLGTGSVAGLTIVGAANNGSGLIRLVVADSSTFTTGQQKTVSDVVGTTEANGTWTVTVIDATHIDLQGSTFANAYVSGGTIGGAVEEIVLGAGLQMNGTTLSAALPPEGSTKKLAIDVLTNTTLSVTADAVVMSDGTSAITRPINSPAVNLGTNGGIDALQGLLTIAAGTMYSIWSIGKADGTTKVLVNTSDTAVTFPSGYTFKALLGHVRTVAGSANLMGTKQRGKKVRYIVGLAQTTAAVVLISGSSGSITTPTWTAVSLSGLVPSSAIIATLSISNNGLANGIAMAAPSNSYGGATSTSSPPPLMTGASSAPAIQGYVAAMGDFLLESTNVYYAANGGTLTLLGWEEA